MTDDDQLTRAPDCTNPTGGHRFPAFNLPGEPAQGAPCIHCGLPFPATSEQPEASVLTRATLDAAFASLMNPQYRPTPMVLPPGVLWPVSDPMPPRSEFQRLVDEAVLAGDHVHTWRDGELRCVMGECDS